MAVIRNFIYCLNTDGTNDSNGTIANNILCTLSPDYIPGAFTFAVVIAITDLGSCGNHKVDIEFYDPDDILRVNLADVEVELPEDANSNMPLNERGFILSAELRNVIFEKQGYYKTKVYCDNEFLGEYLIFAKGRNQ